MADPGLNWVHVFQSAAAADGNGTALDCAGFVMMAAQVVIAGGGAATINWEGSVDGTNYVALMGASLANGAKSATPNAAGIYAVPLAGLRKVRARISGYGAPAAVTVTGCALCAGVLPALA